MPYYLRLFSPIDDGHSEPAIKAGLEDGFHIKTLSTDETGWRQILVSSSGGRHEGDEAVDVCLLERTASDLVAEEVTEFIEELAEIQPRSGADWVADYLQNCKAIYICQFLEGAYIEDEIPPHILWSLKQSFGTGLIHAEGEGFANETGHHITWEFEDDADGPWQMAVLKDQNHWSAFEMDLGNEQHRAAFKAGEVPKKTVSELITAVLNWPN